MSAEGSENGIVKEERVEVEDDSALPSAVYGLRCRACRSALFHRQHVRSHNRKGTGTRCEMGYLVEPMTWMDGTDAYEGDIKCYACQAKLGHFVWGGRHCEGEPGHPCNQHIGPWFHVPKVRVDPVRTRDVLEKRLELKTDRK